MFHGAQECCELSGHRIIGGGQGGLEVLEVLEDVGWEGLAGVVPEDGAEFVLVVEAESVVYGPEVALGVFQAVAAFAVGVVDEGVEGGEDLGVVEVAGVLLEREQVVGGVVLDEELECAGAIGGVGAVDGGGDECVAEGFVDEVGGYFALVECAVGKVPEGALAVAGFVDCEKPGLGMVYPDQHGVVGAIG